MRHAALLSLAFVIGYTASVRAQAADDPGLASAPLIDHVPWNEAGAGESAALRFETAAPDRIGVITVHVVPDARHPAPLALPAQRTARGYRAIIPAERVTPPALHYYVTEARAGSEPRSVFASAESPHRVRVIQSADDEAEQARLRSRGGKRSVVSLQGEAVSFGSRKLQPAGEEAADRYYWLEAGYTYAVLTRVEDVALHVVHVRAEAAEQVNAPEPHGQIIHPGIDAGRAAITWRLLDFVRVRSSLLLGASQRGFEYGVGGDVILGDPQNVSLELGGLAIRTLGETAHLRMGFSALPSLPMGATIEITSFPTGEDPGVRLLYDVGYRFDPTTDIVLRAGYQGRSSVSGGPSLGLRLRYGF